MLARLAALSARPRPWCCLERVDTATTTLACCLPCSLSLFVAGAEIPCTINTEEQATRQTMTRRNVARQPAGLARMVVPVVAAMMMAMVVVGSFSALGVNAQVGRLVVTDTQTGAQKRVCSLYEQDWAPLNNTWSRTQEIALVDPPMGCTVNDTVDISNGPDLNGRIAVFERGNCFFSTKVLGAVEFGAVAVVIVSDGALTEPIAANASDYRLGGVPVMMIDEQDLDLFSFAANTTVEAAFKATTVRSFDENFFVFFLAAWFCLIFAGCWAWNETKQVLGRVKRLNHLRPCMCTAEEVSSIRRQEVVRFANPHLPYRYNLSCAGVKYDVVYLVYVVIALFMLSSTFALQRLLLLMEPTSGPLASTFTIPKLGAASIYAAVTFLFAASIATWWVVVRHEPYAWALQDVLGLAFIISVLQSLRTPSYRVTAALLFGFLLYDVFFVFITPYLTKDNDSVMVKAATGGGTSSEQLPLTLRVPRLFASCFKGESLLGFGDIIIPGLAVVYCAVYDAHRTTSVGGALSFAQRHAYFLTALAAYTFGLAATYVALATMRMAQPALLYLSPSLLIALPLAAWLRGELALFWRGSIKKGGGYQALMAHSPGRTTPASVDDLMIEEEQGEQEQGQGEETRAKPLSSSPPPPPHPTASQPSKAHTTVQVVSFVDSTE
ncbi:hypothetical protein PTSG_11619 [Salpingoeca rosetta]|uniref:PA domain-containing protein n=1 Tax=Salpingoeca rosetta (strain ATCC 50818 / BSB-021) TaxID=946362 RepID=F2TWY6_SALR5|nr:uncharacterized protein PTSG_11619 [Salpingoeca rosetta]EGD75895.1 hypothetical protein PTSG_11619 [Salpingoeca rosetta]|eukprot:XP_004998071.1 hypothetical protein PTSG_11619 [Salpingoeca rosetta]